MITKLRKANPKTTLLKDKLKHKEQMFMSSEKQIFRSRCHGDFDNGYASLCNMPLWDSILSVRGNGECLMTGR